jgi:hypothetical protein
MALMVRGFDNGSGAMNATATATALAERFSVKHAVKSRSQNVRDYRRGREQLCVCALRTDIIDETERSTNQLFARE